MSTNSEMTTKYSVLHTKVHINREFKSKILFLLMENKFEKWSQYFKIFWSGVIKG